MTAADAIGAAIDAKLADRPAVDTPVLNLGGDASLAGDLAPIVKIEDANLVATNESQPLKLRLLSGPLSGADATFRPGEPLIVGRGFRNDVVLRDKAVGKTRLSLSDEDGTVRLKVLSGHVVLLGQRLEAPAEAALPHYLPLAVGATTLAIGRTDEERWRESAAMPAALTAAPPPLPGKKSRKSVHWVRDIAIGTAAFGALAACTMLLAPKGEEVIAEPPSIAARDLLAANGFDEVVITRSAANGDIILVQGFVATDARKAELRDLLDSTGLDYSGQVRSGEAAARQVSDVFASGGFPGAARYVGAGAVAIEGVETDQATAGRLKSQALRDVPFLTSLEVALAKPKPSAKEQAFTAEIVQTSGGPDGHFVTRDGTFYFVGGSTPAGGKITAIGDNFVTIEHGGNPTTFTF